MATALQSFRFTSRGCICRHAAHAFATASIDGRRAFTSTPRSQKKINKDLAQKLEGAGISVREFLAGQELAAKFQSGEALEEIEKEADQLIPELLSDGPPAPALQTGRRKLKQTFLNMGEPEPWEEEHIMEDDHDDITPLGHGELEQHREMRHYARLAAWEMPLLSSSFRDKTIVQGRY